MYIGTTGPDGLHHLVWEVFDNSRDEAMGGFANDIEVVVLPGNSIRVADNGRGIPVDVHKQTKVSALETIMTTLHAGGKFGGEGYKVSGGLHGVGASVVNALSTTMSVEVHRDGGAYIQEYAKGKRKAAIKKVGSSKLHGTVSTFTPDAEIFTTTTAFDFDKIVSHLREQAYLVKGLRITIIDARESGMKFTEVGKELYIRDYLTNSPSQTFYFEGGLRSLIRFIIVYQKPVHKNIFYIEKEIGDIAVEVSLQYVDDITSRLFAFANNIFNGEGGTHVTGFRTSLTRTLNAYARKGGGLKESEENFTGDDVLEGLTAVVSVKMPEIQFEGQTKSKARFSRGAWRR
jgi:DNA gyrase subunit B